jgi:hypothetical protein
MNGDGHFEDLNKVERIILKLVLKGRVWGFVFMWPKTAINGGIP